MAGRMGLAVLVISLVAACSGSDEPHDDVAGDDGGEGDSSFWPADAQDLAVVAGDSSIAVTDGVDVVELVQSSNPDLSMATGTDEVVALDIGDELVAVDLATGETKRHACADCEGVAVVGDRIVSADSTFTMQVFDLDLLLQATIPIDHVTEPPSVDPPPDPEPVTPTVMGVVGDKVAMFYRSTNGLVRGGPDVVSLYGLDGALAQSWTIDGKIYRWAADASGGRLALGAGGSSGACFTLAVPVVIESERLDPIVLVPNAEEERDDGSIYTATDLWWNGTEIVTFGAFGGQGANLNCVNDYLLRRFDLDGELPASTIPEISTYRFLGAGCDRVLKDQPDEGALVLVDESGPNPIDEYHTIIWSAPRPDSCQTFPGLDEP